MAPHSSTLAWKIPWTEEPGGLQSMGSLKSQTQLSDFTFTFCFHAFGEDNGNPLQCSCLENPRDGGAWWAAVYGVTQSRTQLKRLSSSSSSRFYIFKKTAECNDNNWILCSMLLWAIRAWTVCRHKVTYGRANSMLSLQFTCPHLSWPLMSYGIPILKIRKKKKKRWWVVQF